MEAKTCLTIHLSPIELERVMDDGPYVVLFQGSKLPLNYS